MRSATTTVKVGFLAFALACVVTAAPRTASADLALDFTPGVMDALCLPGRHSVDLLFSEFGPTENEGLFAYDLLLTVPAASRDHVTLNGLEAGGPGFVLGDDPNKYTFSVAESDASHVLANISSNNDLFDITTGKRAAKLSFTVAPKAVPFGYSIAIDPGTTVFGSGDPYRTELSIPVDVNDPLTVLCPEPGALALLGLAASVVLRRRRGPAGAGGEPRSAKL